MARYNTFVVCACKSGKVDLVTSSARKAANLLTVGKRVDVWNENEKIRAVHDKSREQMIPYIKQEKEYLFTKQMAAEFRNGMRHTA